jgi:CHRD domain/PEP-CTERM motif
MKTIRFVALTTLFIAAPIAASAARAGIITYDAFLSGPAESPPNASPGTGFADVDFDTTANTMRVRVTFSGLAGTTTASHIHSATAVPGTGTAGVATTTPTFAGFPLGVTSGAYDNTLDMTLASSYNPSYVTANGGTPASAEAALLSSLNAGTAYLNIHTNVFPGGEIRGFLNTVPEPSTWTLSAVGALGIIVFGRARKSIARKV